ncbi:MAG: ABC transporter substrate-binding protein [Clostridia bacterium]|nr:ABC transporter substrate-binding protein [Clostridia bacterium]
MKRFLAVLMVVLLATCCLYACGNAKKDNNSSEKTIKIGVIEPLTGHSSFGGKKEALGVEFANSQMSSVEINGETYKVELVTADNASEASYAPRAAQRLVDKGVSVVIGSYGSGVSLAASDVFNKAQIPVIGATCTNPAVTDGNNHYFRICYNDDLQGSALATFAMERFNATKVYCLGEEDNPYDQGLIDIFSENFTALGGMVVKDSFSRDTLDFSTYINKAKSEGCGVFFCPVSVDYAAQIITQMSRLSVDIPVLGSDSLDDNMVLDAVKGTNVRLYISSFCMADSSNDFYKRIKSYVNSNSNAKTYNGGNDLISSITAMGYDAYYVALEALKNVRNPSPSSIKNAISSVQYNGASGQISFNRNGDAIRDTVYFKVADTIGGTWAFEKEQKVVAE